MESKKKSHSGEEKKHQEEKVDAGEMETVVEEAAKDYEHLYKLALADYQNLLKQSAKDKTAFVKYANEQLLYEVLPVYDHLKLSLAHIDAAAEQSNWLVGVQYVIKQFKEVLERNGVVEVETVGKKFDHATMEAVSSEETGDKEKEGLVAKEVKAGYMLNGKVIIPARVVVFEHKP
ncbi:nucleotide exchange factor GrpE [Candidatus Falkowbacteria bacterium]|nr:nucleotide exchange factor GrpE [Candidatus Falkowbacteria bacterium]